MSRTLSLPLATAPRPAAVGIGRMLIAGFARLYAWQARSHERHALAALDDRMLGDLGLSRADIESEIRKPFWS